MSAASRRRSKARSSGGARRSVPSVRAKSRGSDRRGPPPRFFRLVGAAIVAILGAILLIFFWGVMARPVRHQDGWVRFEASDDRDRVVRSLYEQRLIDAPLFFQIYWRTMAPGAQLRPGTHLLEYGLTARQLVQRLTESARRPVVNVTVIEGADRWDIAERLHRAGVVDRDRFLQAMTNPALLAECGIAADSAEGYLFPATYPLGLDSPAPRVIRRMAREAKKRLQQLRGSLAPGGPPLALNETELITLASLVEKETPRSDERARVAQVFYNRLKDPSAETLGRLQSDPTAAYGCRLDPGAAPSCAAFTGKVTPRMLGDSQNAYNTYRHAGLPPGPIGNPGLESLRAALVPASGDELYFVADGAGGHRFSRTFEEHRTAVEALRQRRGL